LSDKEATSDAFVEDGDSPLAEAQAEKEGVRDFAEMQTRTSKQQPMFQRPPRFKATETEIARLEGLPEAFSPQHRGGRKYIPGGLAAELQGWLSAVKDWDGDDLRHHHNQLGECPAMRILVDEVRVAENMYLVVGRTVRRDAESGDDYAVAAPTVKVLLAGEGKLTGLGRRAKVLPGAIAGISGPLWEVSLDGNDGVEGRWIVACDWSILEKKK
jgi:hypothetical protein